MNAKPVLFIPLYPIREIFRSLRQQQQTQQLKVCLGSRDMLHHVLQI